MANQCVEENCPPPPNKGPSPKSANVVRDDVDAKEKNNMLVIEIEKRLRVGSTVLDLEQAYLIYCEYGRCKGFGVRKGEQRYFGNSTELKWKEYVCCCAGGNDGSKHVGHVADFKKLIMRTGCGKIRREKPFLRF